MPIHTLLLLLLLLMVQWKALEGVSQGEGEEVIEGVLGDDRGGGVITCVDKMC